MIGAENQRVHLSIFYMCVCRCVRVCILYTSPLFTQCLFTDIEQYVSDLISQRIDPFRRGIHPQPLTQRRTEMVTVALNLKWGVRQRCNYAGGRWGDQAVELNALFMGGPSCSHSRANPEEIRVHRQPVNVALIGTEGRACEGAREACDNCRTISLTSAFVSGAVSPTSIQP
jgi:hypothetical protein